MPTYYDSTKDPEIHSVLTKGLKIAFKYYYSGFAGDSDAIYVYAALFTSDTDQSESHIIWLEMEDWDLQEFVGSTADIDYQENNKWFKYPENVTLTGNHFSHKLSFVRLFYGFNYWDSPSSCRAQANTENVDSYIILHVVTPYIDYNDIDEPIKYASMDKYYSHVDPKSYNHYDIFIQK